MRRRRRRKVFWFPNLGTVGPAAEPDDDDYGLWIQLQLDSAQSTSSIFITDLTFDRPIEEDEQSAQLRLSSVVGGEYLLRRIVGNCFVSREVRTAGAEPGFSPPIVATAGFFVARSEDSSNEDIGNAAPIGAESTTERRENYSPGSVSTVREPWIWRKRWILGNYLPGTSNFLITSDRSGLMSYPPNNALYPSSRSDQTIDAKTIRRVSNDDRLWFIIAARALNTGEWIGEGASPFAPATGTPQEIVRIKCHLDYRLLGHMTRVRGKGTF